MSFCWILIPTLSYTIFTFIRLNFLQLKSFKTTKDVSYSTNTNSTNNSNVLYMFYILLFSLVAFWINNYLMYSTSFVSYYFWNPNILINILLCLITIIFTASIYFNTNSLILGNFSLIFSLTTCILMTTTNLLQFYIVLEILAYVNILFFILFKINSQTQSNQWLVASIISFLLNFIASILFFSFIVLWMWRIIYPSWEILLFFKVNTVESVTITLFVLVKLGVGPWLVGNYHSYLGYNLYYLIIYTINMLLIVTPILLTLLQSFSSFLLILAFLIFTYIYIASTLNSVKSLKSLFAYSTVIIYTYMFLICIF